MITPKDKPVTYTVHGWYMPNGKSPANKKCIAEGCDEWAAYHLCDQHAIPGMVVEAGTGDTFVISAWLVAWAGRMLLITLNDFTPGTLFGGREAFEDQLSKQGYTIQGLISSEAELDAATRRHPQLRMTPWVPTLPGSKDELPL